MSKLYYNIRVSEEQNFFNDGKYQLVEENLPHFKEVKDMLTNNFNSMNKVLKESLPESLKGKVENFTMMVYEDKNKKCIARITVDFVDGFRLSEKRRNCMWEYLDGQIADGWGESIDYSRIPGVEGDWTICL